MNSNPAKQTVEAPKHLKSEASRALWISINTEFPELEQHHGTLALGTCEALDRAVEAREAIERDGAYVKNRFGDLVKHPAIGVERDAWTTFARLLRELDLDIEAPGEAKRPPMLRSIRGGASAR